MNELMGKVGEEKSLTLDDLPALLGDALPHLPRTPVGRLRLTLALRNRLGDNWRSLPHVKSLLKEFDDEASFNVKLAEMKMIKVKK